MSHHDQIDKALASRPDLAGTSPRLVEAYMRLDSGPDLEHIPEPVFNVMARTCAIAVQSNPDLADQLATNYGL